MKKLLLLSTALSIMMACKKDESAGPSECKQCVMVITDSASGAVLETQTGSPTSESMYRCGEVLKMVEARPVNYQHYAKYNTAQYGYSKTQGFKEQCN